MQLHVFRASAPYQEKPNGSAVLEEIMLSQALRPGIRHAIAAFSLASLAAAAGAGAAPAAPGHDRPFKGSLDGTYALAFPNPQTLLVTGTGTGHATSLGSFTFTYDETVNLTTGVGIGTYEFTAANGDTLTAEWIGTGFPTSDPNVLRIVENAIISSGTGRFAQAGGTFTVERFFDFTTNAGPGSFDGDIHLR
jgi:hypothetical protein